MARSPLTDRCECAWEDDLAPADPHTVTWTGNDSLRADYRCQHCGREWFTGWDACAAGWPTLAPVIGRSRFQPVLEQLR